jgi:hypothetical protein
MLYNAIKNNLNKYNNLKVLLNERTGINNIDRLKENDFETFFKISLPKIITNIAMENDWYVQPENGITVYEFERPSRDGPYKILHLMMEIQRKNPPIESRAPGDDSEEAVETYKKIVEKIFLEEEMVVTNEGIEEPKLMENLNLILSRRKKYNPDNVN